MSRVSKDGQELPMPSDSEKRYRAQIKKMYIASLAWVIAIIFTIFGAEISLVSFLRKAWISAAIFSVLFLAAVAIILSLHLYFRNHAVYHVFQFACKHGSLENLIAYYSAIKRSDDLYEGKTIQRKGICFTIRIIQMDSLEISSFKEIKAKMKRVMPDREKTVGLYSGGLHAKVYLIVCNHVTAQALNKIAENTKKNLNRTECLFYAVISLEDALLHFPDVYDGLEYLQVKRYESFCDIVMESVM